MNIDYEADGDAYMDCEDCGVAGCEKCCNEGIIYLPFVCGVDCGEGFFSPQDRRVHMLEKHGVAYSDNVPADLM